MKGRRLPVGVWDDPEYPEMLGKPKLNLPTQPGDYCGPLMGYTGDLPAVFFLKPNARDKGVRAHARSVQHVTSPPHTFTEEPDGTLTITPSLSDLRTSDVQGVTNLGSDGWHGHLTCGEWVKA